MKTSALLLSLALLTLVPPLSLRGDVVEDKFREFDADSDGVISGPEFNASTILRPLDLNADGSLTLAEAKQALQGRLPRAAAGSSTAPARGGDALFSRLDRNGDGTLSRDELPGRGFATADADGNGAVTREEARQAISRLVERGRGFPSEASPATPASEDPNLKEAPLILKGTAHGIGQLVPDLPLTDDQGGTASLRTRLRGSQGIVLAFFGATCPISNKLGPELARLEKEAAQHHLNMLLVCPIPSESTEDIRAFTGKYRLRSPVLHDRDRALSLALAATTTTEAFLIDSASTLVYRGAINDQYGLGYSREAPTQNYLRDAAAAMLRGELPDVAATTAPGCALDTTPAQAPKMTTRSATDPVTYHNQVARILQNNCIECHRSGGVAPFSLEKYEDVIENAGMIRKQVERGAMPPWFAAPMEGQIHSPWRNDTSLSEKDKSDLLAWLQSERPRGDPALAPRPLTFPAEWTIGTPDAVVQLPKPFNIKAEGTMPYQFATVTTSFGEDRWVRGYEIMPTDRAVVHHVIVQVHPKGQKITNRGEGAEGYWAAYVPGNASHIYPEGFAKKLPAGATVSFQIHYTPNGKATQDQLKMGLLFAREAPRYVVHTAAVANGRLNIPPGAADHVESGERTVPADINITAYMAHMHVRGKAFKFDITYPDGKQEVLLDIPRYDFNWQLRYDYAQPKFFPRGSKVKITAVFDNSPANPANPDPTKTVRWGPQTSDEMMIGYFEYYTPNSGEVAGL